jgi:tetratricopeptide (TPR) repeat protein
MAALPQTFPDARAAIEHALKSGRSEEAEQLVSRLKEKARFTRSREQDALAWFARGILEAGTHRWAAAEQSLLVAVNIGRDLFKELNDALGYVARSLGFVYAQLERPDSAAEMFLLARNVFLKTQPQLAPEVVRLAASCNIALRLPELALAIVHQELGAPEARTTPRTTEELQLYLVRARAFEEQQKPAQALKALARVTQLLRPEPMARSVVAQAWIAIARIWSGCGDKQAASHALHCAILIDGSRDGSSSSECREAARDLKIDELSFFPSLAWRIQRTMGSAVAFASPARGLFFEPTSSRVDPLARVAAQLLPDGRWLLRRPLKLVCGYLEGHLLSLWNSKDLALIRPFEPVKAGDVLQLDNGLSAPTERTVHSARTHRVVLDSAPYVTAPNALGEYVPGWMGVFVGTVWAPNEARSLTPADDEVVRALLKSGG